MRVFCLMKIEKKFEEKERIAVRWDGRSGY